MPSHELRLVIRRGLDVAPSHPPRVALSAVLTFTTKKCNIFMCFCSSSIYVFLDMWIDKISKMDGLLPTSSILFGFVEGLSKSR
ncbi:hypothetical protein OSB04_016514 [Centaurea solstitialis]|uniref:Uncharacterized protein n=1 Tax=Centaurea solstitialis TaxID=347529 RepID=A0AA38WJS9_9ASTR|nr:hypothetical protein OSB04_016514 [Centaurea solstitialis]